MTAGTVNNSLSNSNSLLDEFHSSNLNPPLLQSLLVKLLSHPTIFNGFNDILNLPSVQSTLAKMDDEKRSALITTVQLFAYGTISDYFDVKNKDETGVWILNDAQIEKLRMLSVVSIARGQIDGSIVSSSSSSSGGNDVEMMSADTSSPSKAQKKSKRRNKKDGNMLSISYAKLASELHIPNDGSTYNDKDHMRTLEDLLIQCIYSNLISAKLDQASKSLKIEPSMALDSSSSSDNAAGAVYGSIFSRDMNTSTPDSTNMEVSRMITTLEGFLKQSNALLSTLDHASNEKLSDRTLDELRWKEVQKVIDDGPTKLREGALGSGSVGDSTMMGHGGGGDPMDVVDLSGRRQVKRSKGGHSMMSGWGN